MIGRSVLLRLLAVVIGLVLASPATAQVEAEGLIWRAPVAEGLTGEDVDASLRSLAAGFNLRNVGELPLGEQVALMQGAPWRDLRIYMFCNPLTAARMIEHDPAFAVWLPCRVSLVEDGAGRLWLYSVNMDALLSGTTPMPAELAAEVAGVRDAIHALIAGAAQGEF